MLVEHLIAEGRAASAPAQVELRCSERLDIRRGPAQEHKVNHDAADLPCDAGTLWRRFDKKVRNQVRKAERAGLTVEPAASSTCAAFYDAFVVRMRDLGSPVHAPRVSARRDRGVRRPRAHRARAEEATSTIGGLIALAFKDRLVVPWATCLKELLPALSEHAALLGHPAARPASKASRRFDFGRSTRDSGHLPLQASVGRPGGAAVLVHDP